MARLYWSLIAISLLRFECRASPLNGEDQNIGPVNITTLDHDSIISSNYNDTETLNENITSTANDQTWKYSTWVGDFLEHCRLGLVAFPDEPFLHFFGIGATRLILLDSSLDLSNNVSTVLGANMTTTSSGSGSGSASGLQANDEKRANEFYPAQIDLLIKPITRMYGERCDKVSIRFILHHESPWSNTTATNPDEPKLVVSAIKCRERTPPDEHSLLPAWPIPSAQMPYVDFAAAVTRMNTLDVTVQNQASLQFTKRSRTLVWAAYGLQQKSPAPPVLEMFLLDVRTGVLRLAPPGSQA